MSEQPSKKCAFCGEGYVCEHGKCNVCQKCRACERQDDASNELGVELATESNPAPWRKSKRGWMGARNQFDLGDD